MKSPEVQQTRWITDIFIFALKSLHKPIFREIQFPQTIRFSLFVEVMTDIGGIPMQSEATAKTSDTLFSKINFPNLGLLNTYKWFQWRYPSGKNDTEIVKGSALDSYSMSNKNRILLGRKDFIHFIEEHPAIFSKNLFHLWTHCNIQKNIPTYTPIAIAGSSIDYEKEALKKEAVNPDFLNIRVQNEFLRRNGQTARPGEPLVTQRFPLQYTL